MKEHPDLDMLPRPGRKVGGGEGQGEVWAASVILFPNKMGQGASMTIKPEL